MLNGDLQLLLPDLKGRMYLSGHKRSRESDEMPVAQIINVPINLGKVFVPVHKPTVIACLMPMIALAPRILFCLYQHDGFMLGKAKLGDLKSNFKSFVKCIHMVDNFGRIADRVFVQLHFKPHKAISAIQNSFCNSHALPLKQHPIDDSYEEEDFETNVTGNPSRFNAPPEAYGISYQR